MCKSAPQNIPYDSPWLIFPRTETPIISYEPNSTRMACCSLSGQFSGHFSLTAAATSSGGKGWRLGDMDVTVGEMGEWE